MLTSLENVKQQLNIATAATGDDAFLTALIERASGEVQHVCNYLFEPGSYDEWHHVPIDTLTIYADQAPVTAVESIAIALFPGQDETELDAETYFLNPNNKLGRIDLAPLALSSPASLITNGWPDDEEPTGMTWVHLEYDAGMDPIDPDLESVVIRLVVAWFKSRDVNLVLASERNTNYAYSLRTPKEIQDWLPQELAHHRKPTMA